MSYYRRLIVESEKKRILGMHNTYKHNPKTWVIREAYSGKPGEGFDSVEGCKKEQPLNAALKIGLVKNNTDWAQLKKDFGSDGTMSQNLVLRNAICDGWRKGDPKDGGAQTQTGEQTGGQTGEQTGEQPKDGGPKFIEPIFPSSGTLPINNQTGGQSPKAD